MAIDAPTMLTLTLAIAAIAAGFLGAEWRATRDAALARWSAGFAAIAIGCAISPLRQSVSPVIGVWVANGLLVVAHLLFLRGTALFAGRGTHVAWLAVLLPWVAMLCVPIDAGHSSVFGMVNAGLVGVLALRTARVAFEAGGSDASARRLGLVFLAHGLFYVVKTALVFAPGAFVNMLALKGLLIQLSLLEGIVVAVTLALLMAAAVRRRREDRAVALAERDPLTGLLNRRAFRQQAERLLGPGSPRHWRGALVLVDVDHFKAVNDGAGHAIGDRLLMALAGLMTVRMPEAALVARLGGDEFVAMISDVDAIELQVLSDAVRRDLATAGRLFLPAGLTATLSLGGALSDDAEDLDALMARADAALYDAKRRGRDRLCLREAATAGAAPAVAEPLSLVHADL